MRIKQSDGAAARGRRLLHEISAVEREGPLPDPVCDPGCPHYDGIRPCQRECSNAPAQLSSEGADYPVEPLVAPLVFELLKLRVYEPCWSCEGHNDRDGKLWKIPRVWFYCESVNLLRALKESIDIIGDSKRLKAPWRIVMTHSDLDNPDTTFSLEPAVSLTDFNLAALQADLAVLATELPDAHRRACSRLKLNAV